MHHDGQPRHILVINHAPEGLEHMRDLLEDEGFRATALLRDGQRIEAIDDFSHDLIAFDSM